MGGHKGVVPPCRAPSFIQVHSTRRPFFLDGASDRSIGESPHGGKRLGLPSGCCGLRGPLARGEASKGLTVGSHPTRPPRRSLTTRRSGPRRARALSPFGGSSLTRRLSAGPTCELSRKGRSARHDRSRQRVPSPECVAAQGGAHPHFGSEDICFRRWCAHVSCRVAELDRRHRARLLPG